MSTLSKPTKFCQAQGGGHLAYQVQGAGDPLLLVRPLGGTMALWGPFREALAKHFRVVTFDHRGTGQSHGDSRVHISTKLLADDALTVLQAEGIERANVFGLSLGGMTATWLAILAPERVRRLCIACAPLVGLEFTLNGVMRELKLAATMLKPGNEVEVELVHRVLSREFCDAHPQRVAEIEEIVAQQPSSRQALARLVLAGVLHNALGNSDRIVSPTLVLAGEHDQLLGVHPPQHLAEKLGARATFQIIESAGHDLSLEQPEQTADAVRRFFE